MSRHSKVSALPKPKGRPLPFEIISLFVLLADIKQVQLDLARRGLNTTPQAAAGVLLYGLTGSTKGNA